MYNFFADIKLFYYLCKVKIYIVGANETYNNKKFWSS